MKFREILKIIPIALLVSAQNVAAEDLAGVQLIEKKLGTVEAEAKRTRGEVKKVWSHLFKKYKDDEEVIDKGMLVEIRDSLRAQRLDQEISINIKNVSGGYELYLQGHRMRFGSDGNVSHNLFSLLKETYISTRITEDHSSFNVWGPILKDIRDRKPVQIVLSCGKPSKTSYIEYEVSNSDSIVVKDKVPGKNGKKSCGHTLYLCFDDILGRDIVAPHGVLCGRMPQVSKSEIGTAPE